MMPGRNHGAVCSMISPTRNSNPTKGRLYRHRGFPAYAFCVTFQTSKIKNVRGCPEGQGPFLGRHRRRGLRQRATTPIFTTKTCRSENSRVVFRLSGHGRHRARDGAAARSTACAAGDWSSCENRRRPTGCANKKVQHGWCRWRSNRSGEADCAGACRLIWKFIGRDDGPQGRRNSSSVNRCSSAPTLRRRARPAEQGRHPAYGVRRHHEGRTPFLTDAEKMRLSITRRSPAPRCRS